MGKVHPVVTPQHIHLLNFLKQQKIKQKKILQIVANREFVSFNTPFTIISAENS